MRSWTRAHFSGTGIVIGFSSWPKTSTFLSKSVLRHCLSSSCLQVYIQYSPNEHEAYRERDRDRERRGVEIITVWAFPGILVPDAALTSWHFLSHSIPRPLQVSACTPSRFPLTSPSTCFTKKCWPQTLNVFYCWRLSISEFMQG